MTENVRLQNLRDFTVQIRNAADKTVGTGIAVSTDGKIVTCAHVVQSALGAHPREVNGAEVGVYFPQVRGGEDKKYNAKVNCCFHEHDDDMVLLQIIGEKSPLAPEQIAVLGMADQSEGNPFRTYGYSPIGNYPAARGDGIILGTVEPPVNRNLQVDPVQLKSRDIAAGMSGAAVLDVTRNLVVGLVMERFYSAHAVQDDIGYGVDSKVLTFDPFDFVLRGEALELKPAPELRLDKDLFQQAIEIVNYVRAHRKPEDRFSWNSAPTVLPEWTGRDDLLAQITADWNNPQKHVTGLIGFGGEGKSSLARKWVDDVCRGGSRSAPTPTDGVFWWGFYENRSIDEFLEAALNFLSDGRIDPRQVPSSSLRAQIIGAMLGAGRYLFILDGLEVLQHQEGDQYGLLTSNDLRDLLTYFARPDNQSFCLITSRAPALDLMDYTTYTHRDVERLSEADGVALLERLQVKGSKSQLGKVVADWDGHALTISLLGSYLAEKYNGDIAHLADIPIPTADEPRYERVHRVLRRYDEHLTAAEREFLKLFSAFRTPVHESAFEKVFVPLLGNAVGAQHAAPLRDMVNRLVTYRILHCDTTSQTYTAHPLVRNHYLAILTHGDSKEQQDVHGKIKDYYLSIAGDTPQYPTLDDLKPLIEAVHHACLSGKYDEAHHIHKDLVNPIDEKGSYLLVNKLGAYQTEIEIIFDFFPERDTNSDPYGNSSYILNQAGYCLGGLGRLGESLAFLKRSCQLSVEKNDWSRGSQAYRTLAEICSLIGLLDDGNKAISESLLLAHKAGSRGLVMGSLVIQGWIADLRGNFNIASKSFSEAEVLEREDSPNSKYLTKQAGCHHATFLRHIGEIEYARQIIESNIQFCRREQRFYNLSECYRVLGDLEANAAQYDNAQSHYNEAIKIARNTVQKNVLIRALEARGCFLAHQRDVISAHKDLEEALSYVSDGGHRLHEANIRTGLAWAYLANGEKEKAQQSAQRALQMSQEMGYHWGKVDAEEVLNVIASER